MATLLLSDKEREPIIDEKLLPSPRDEIPHVQAVDWTEEEEGRLVRRYS